MSRLDSHKIGKKYTDQLGLSKNFFYNLRNNNLDCFDYITDKDPNDIVSAYKLFLKEKDLVQELACEIYHILEDKYQLDNFGRFLVHKGLYSNPRTYFYTYRNIFKGGGIKSFKTFINTKKSNAYYEEFKELQNGL